MRKHEHKLAACAVCGAERPVEAMVRGEAVRSSIAALIRKKVPSWTSDDSICLPCLDSFRAQYVENVIEEQKGGLTRVEEDVVRSFKEYELLSADLNAEFDKQQTFAEKTADKLASFGGSWQFIILFSALMVAWIAGNTLVLSHKPFDPYPFILLNLVLSCVAAIQAPVIMMSQNRQEAKDRLRAEHDYRVNLKAELEVRHLNEKMDLLITRQWQRLLEVQQIQLELLQELTKKRDGEPG